MTRDGRVQRGGWVKVHVVRQDSLRTRAGQFVQSNRGFLAAPVTAGNASQQGSGFELELPATEADVLSALTKTGGVPGIDAKNDILIYRKVQLAQGAGRESGLSRHADPERISMKIKKGEQPNISEADVSLGEGDLVVIEARESEQYYTAGLMFNQEIPMPLDFDLTVVEAVTRVGGPVMNGGFGGANLNGNIVNTGIGNPNPSLLTVLRKAPNGRQVPIRVDLTEALRDPRENILVMNGDVLILQETTGESFARYLTNVFNFSGTGTVGQNAAGASFHSRAVGGSIGPIP